MSNPIEIRQHSSYTHSNPSSPIIKNLQDNKSINCGFSSFLLHRNVEKIVLRQIRLQTEYTGLNDVLIKITDPPDSQGYNIVKLASYNHGINITVIDANDYQLDPNNMYSIDFLKRLKPKEVDCTIANYHSDVLVNCYEYINFLHEHNIKFPYSDLIVISGISNMENAFWNGSYFVIGNGITNSSRALSSPCIIAHELTHACTQAYVRLNYQYESGALNESYSDIFGVMFEFWIIEKRNSIGWEIGNECFFDHHSMRSFKDPNSCGCPSSVRDPLFHRSPSDNGGVHINSSIINHLFYLLQLESGKKEIFDIFLKVYFKLKHNSTFSEFKELLLRYAINGTNYSNIIYSIL